ncbi:MAG: acetylornithine deacetylase [Beijerinckiaceae bacterium]
MTTNATTLDILSKLVSFDTTSRNSNIACADWIAACLAGFGVEVERFPDETGTKHSLYAIIGPRDVPGYVLSAHTDVVPVDGQAWSSDPFTLRIEGSRAYGRGACDMKGFLACTLAMAPAMVAAKLRTPIHLAYSYDEEVGCIGVRDMLAKLAPREPKPIAAFIGEPTSMQVIIGHKGGQRVNVHVRGKAAHSSLAPHGVNAVEFGALFVARLREMADKLTDSGPRDALYDVQHSTLHCGIFRGGVSPNIVPHEAEIWFECRHISADDPMTYIGELIRYAEEELTPRMRKIDPEAGFTFELRPPLPALETAPDHQAVTLAKRLAGRNDHAKVAYGTEASLFQQLCDIPSVVVGPGDIGQAHKPDEWVAISELEKCNAFIGKLIDECTA